MKKKLAILVTVLVVVMSVFGFMKLSQDIPAPSKQVERDVDINKIIGNG